MEIQLDDMTLGFQEKIYFRDLRNEGFMHYPSFKLMATSDGKSYVITYLWMRDDDPYHKVFNDREEAFYIDGVTEENKDKATQIFLAVHRGLLQAFSEDPYQIFEMEPLVRSVVETYGKSSHK